MKYYTFYRESNNFDDILSDVVIKKYIDEKVRWKNYLNIGVRDSSVNKVSIHITLKYGDELRTDFIKDYSPIPNVDYVPKRS